MVAIIRNTESAGLPDLQEAQVRIEVPEQVLRVFHNGHDVIAQSKVDCEPWLDAPVVLDEGGISIIAQMADGVPGQQARGRDRAGKEIDVS